MSKKVRLRDLEITRVALVGRGANPLADIVFFKNHPDDKETSMKIPKLDRKNLSKEQSTALDGILKAMNLEEMDVDFSKASADEVMKTLPEAVQIILKTAQETAVAEAVKKVKPEPAPEPKKEDVLKDLSPAARALVEKAEATAAAAQKAAEDAQREARVATEKANKEAEKREEAEFVGEAESFLKHYPGKIADTGRLLFRVKKSLGEDDYKALITLLKAGNEAIAKAFDEDGEANGDGLGSAHEMLKEKAKELQKADPKLTASKAYVLACQQNPELLKKYNEENRPAVEH